MHVHAVSKEVGNDNPLHRLVHLPDNRSARLRLDPALQSSRSLHQNCRSQRSAHPHCCDTTACHILASSWRFLAYACYRVPGRLVQRRRVLPISLMEMNCAMKITTASTQQVLVFFLPLLKIQCK